MNSKIPNKNGGQTDKPAFTLLLVLPYNILTLTFNASVYKTEGIGYRQRVYVRASLEKFYLRRRRYTEK